METWGYIAPEQDIRDVFNWLDSDKDGQVSFEDLRESIGLDVSPTEGVYFRQNIRNSKSQPCNFDGCWENTLYNNRSAYCPLHQKIMKNSTVDLFNQISQKMPQQEWELFTSEIIKTRYRVSLRHLSDLLEQFTNEPLTRLQMTSIFETFKVHRNIEDNPDELSERHVNVKDLVSARLTRKTKRINDLIALQKDKQQNKEDEKLKGLLQVDETYIGPIMSKNQNKMARVWRSIKEVDDDKNGFLLTEELEACFVEHFAPELLGRSLIYFFRRWSTDHDKDLVNYRLIKDAIMEKVNTFQTPVKEMAASGYMQRSGTMAALGTDLKNKMGLASNNKPGGFESYINKPLKATSGMIDMEKHEEGQYGVDADKLPKLNRFNVRALDQSSDSGMVTPDRRSGINHSASHASFAQRN